MRINSHTGTVTSEAVRDEDAYEREVLARAAAAREQVVCILHPFFIVLQVLKMCHVLLALNR